MKSASRGAHRSCSWQDCATLHLLGNLTPQQSDEYLAHLSSCADCRAELAQSETAVAEVDVAWARAEMERGELPAPSSELRRRLIERIELEARPASERKPMLERSWRHWESSPPSGASSNGFGPGLYAVAARAGEWESTGIAGIEVKRLATDAQRRVVTMLIRMAAGTAYPAHRHASDEECFVVSGAVKVGDTLLRAGDYQKAAAGSVHEVQSTDEGCVLFIVSSQDDELISA